MASPQLSRSAWKWVALGLAGLAIAALGALFFVSAWDGYLAANPSYLQDLGHPPPVTSVEGMEANLAVAMLALGYLGALVASLMRLRSTGAGWMLLRALAALAPIPISFLWLRIYFPFFVNHICGDCSPFEPTIPDVFGFGGNLLAGAAFLGLVLCVVFLALAIYGFLRTRRAPADLPAPLGTS